MRSELKVISYLRFSNAEQIKGDSKRRQLALSDKWAAKNNLKIDDSLIDPGVSAFRGANAATGKLSLFLGLVAEGKIPKGSTLLVESLDRLSRNDVLTAVNLFTSILEAGIKIVTLIDDREYTAASVAEHPYDLMQSIMVFIRANEESKTKSKRIGEAWQTKRSKIGVEGQKLFTRMIPNWLKFDGKKIVIDEPKTEIVRTIYKLAAMGHGLSFITRQLNQQSESFARVTHFNRSYVHKILKSRAVLGEFQPHKLVYEKDKKRREAVGDPIPNYYPRIISDNQYNAVRFMMRSRNQVGGPQSKYVNLFSGLLYCVSDESTIRIAHKGEGGRRYCSSAAIDGRKGASAAIMFPVRPFEQAMLLRLYNVDLFGEKKNDKPDFRQQIAAVQGQIGDVNEKIKEITTALLDGTGGKSASVVAMLNMLDERKGELSAKLELLRERATTPTKVEPATVTDFFSLIDRQRKGELSHGERERLKAIISKLLKRIDCHFIRESRDYICGSRIVFHDENIEPIEFTFRADHIDQMNRDKNGHPLKHEGKPPEPKYAVGVLVA